jgi:hypothetical protein
VSLGDRPTCTGTQTVFKRGKEEPAGCADRTRANTPLLPQRAGQHVRAARAHKLDQRRARRGVPAGHERRDARNAVSERGRRVWDALLAFVCAAQRHHGAREPADRACSDEGRRHFVARTAVDRAQQECCCMLGCTRAIHADKQGACVWRQRVRPRWRGAVLVVGQRGAQEHKRGAGHNAPLRPPRSLCEQAHARFSRARTRRDRRAGAPCVCKTSSTTVCTTPSATASRRNAESARQHARAQVSTARPAARRASPNLRRAARAAPEALGRRVASTAAGPQRRGSLWRPSETVSFRSRPSVSRPTTFPSPQKRTRRTL